MKMRVEELGLHNFRNYVDAHVFFSPKRNFIFGLNAQGKSNLLEAIALLCLTKSQRSAKEEEVLRFGSEQFEVSGTFVDERGLRTKASITFQKAGKKQIGYNGKWLQRQADLVGKLPIVFFSPESHRITSGPPNERRRFMDVLLCQGSPAYLSDLQEYSRILRQRNALLATRRSPQEDEMLAVWDEAISEVGARIVNARAQFFDAVSTPAHEIYQQVDSSGGRLKLEYRSQVEAGDEARESFRDILQQRRTVDWQRAQTTSGPHRDDMDIFISEVNLRAHGSRGEHKSVLMALKLIEAQYLQQQRDTTPMVILDDLFSELDEKRAQRCLDLFTDFCQLFVSSVAPPQVTPQAEDLFIEIKSGAVVNSRQTN